MQYYYIAINVLFLLSFFSSLSFFLTSLQMMSLSITQPHWLPPRHYHYYCRMTAVSRHLDSDLRPDLDVCQSATRRVNVTSSQQRPVRLVLCRMRRRVSKGASEQGPQSQRPLSHDCVAVEITMANQSSSSEDYFMREKKNTKKSSSTRNLVFCFL